MTCIAIVSVLENLKIPIELLVIAAVASVLFFVIAILSRRTPREIFPYAAKPVLTDAELSFHRTLQRCVPRGMVLLFKVRLADFLEVTESGDSYLRYFGKISQKHADFLLVDAETSEPMLVIELDDSSHQRSKRTIESDGFKDRGFEAAGLPVLRVKAARSYRQDEIATGIRAALAVER